MEEKEIKTLPPEDIAALGEYLTGYLPDGYFFTLVTGEAKPEDTPEDVDTGYVSNVGPEFSAGILRIVADGLDNPEPPIQYAG